MRPEVIEGDVGKVLKTLDDESVQCVVTSPPYWGLRDYGTATWEGGDEDCEHTVSMDLNYSDPKRGKGSLRPEVSHRGGDASKCRLCGAKRIDDQLGLEATPEEYVENMVSVFQEVKRVLRKDGTVWLNLGDTFMDKSMVGIPWRVAFALQADGWYLRSDIIWDKPNPMPEPVKDRPTKSHEYIFLLTKSKKYYYDADAIRVPLSEVSKQFLDVANGNPLREVDGFSKEKRYATGGKLSRAEMGNFVNPMGANKRSVWKITTKPYKEAHFATFPEELPELCIKAGTKKGDVVLDIFAGSGTTLRVASKLGRKGIGIELNPEYIKILKKRCKIESVSLEAFA